MAKKILLVEDSPTQAYNLQMALVKKGYVVDVARDGEFGVTLANEFQPHVIILDMYLPTMTGLEVCKVLKSNLDTRTMTVVMYSQENRLQVIANAYEAGADCYISKNAEGAEVLVAVVETIIARQEVARRRTRPASILAS